jgi:hypothetical protein
MARDNAIGAVGKIIKFHFDIFNYGAYLAIWV